MPHGALLIVSEDELASGASYFQDALRDRTDVRVAQASYRARFEHRIGLTVPRGPRSSIKQLFTTFALDYQLPTAYDELATHYQDKYAQTWRILAHELELAGHRAEADQARAFATALAPRASD